MTVNWKKLLIKTSLWLLGEIYLNSVGLDSLVDYGEFLFTHPRGTLQQSIS